MTKPHKDLPDDIWEAALEHSAGIGTLTEAFASIAARAIMAEREACAQIAENATRITYMHWDPEGLEPVETKIDYREKIAETIRNRSES